MAFLTGRSPLNVGAPECGGAGTPAMSGSRQRRVIDDIGCSAHVGWPPGAIGWGVTIVYKGGTVRTPSRALAGTAAGLFAAAFVLVAGSGSQAAPANPAQA